MVGHLYRTTTTMARRSPTNQPIGAPSSLMSCQTCPTVVSAAYVPDGAILPMSTAFPPAVSHVTRTASLVRFRTSIRVSVDGRSKT